MSPQITTQNLETKLFATILRNLANDFIIMRSTLLPEHDDEEEYHCPGMKINFTEKNIWKLQNLNRTIVKILFDAYTTMNRPNICLEGFSDMRLKSYNLRAPFFEYNTVLDEEVKLQEKLREVKVDLKKINNMLSEEQSLLPRLRDTLDNQLKKVEDMCGNRLNYTIRFLEASENGQRERNCVKLEKQQQCVKGVATKSLLENQCTLTMQSFLETSRLELLEEMNQCLELQEKLFAEKEQKMQITKVETEFLEAETTKNQQMFEERLKKCAEFKIARDGRNNVNSAVLSLQTWWRALVAKKDDDFFQDNRIVVKANLKKKKKLRKN